MNSFDRPQYETELEDACKRLMALLIAFLIRHAFHLVKSCDGVANVRRIVQRLFTWLRERVIANRCC